MKSLFAALALVFMLALVGAAAPAINPARALTRDLGGGLIYYRVHAAPADLPAAAPSRRQAYVLDLRYLHADADSAAVVQEWIRVHAAQRTPVFVLANGETNSAFLTPSPPAGVVVIGASAPGFTPDIAVQTSPENERLAYDAFEAGATPAALIGENTDKARNDEASLSRDRSTEPAGDLPGDDSAKNRPAPVPTDAALQRAVHLHRALAALRKI